MRRVQKTMIGVIALSLLITSGCHIRLHDFGKEGSTFQSSPEISSAEDSAVSVESSERKELKEKIEAYHTKYFVQKLDDSQLKYFSVVYEAIKNFQSDVNFDYSINANTLDIIMYLINYDCPELIQVNGEYIPKYLDEEHTSVSGVTLSFVMDSTQYATAMQSLDAAWKDFQKAVRGKHDYDKEKYVYDYLFKNVVYDETTDNAGSVYGALIEHKARCEGLCKSFMWLMRNMGVECMSVRGTPKWNNESVYASHSWNMVKIDGQWYYLDITVDNLKTDENADDTVPNYGFFNVNDALIQQSHTVDSVYISLGIPECTHTEANYHVKNQLYIAKTDDVKSAVTDILESCFKKNQTSGLSVRFEDEENYRTAELEMESYIRDFLLTRSDSNYTYSFYPVELSKVFVIHLSPTELSESSS